MKKLVWMIALIALIVPVAVLAANDDLVVVVNKANSTSDLTKSQLRKLVLGEQGSWPGGAKVMIVLQGPGSVERAGVLRTVCRMSEDDYNQHLMHDSFNGNSSSAPRIAPSALLVRQIVAGNPGAIGFLHATDVNDSVKTVSIEGTTAGQPDYKIKAGK